MNKEVYTAGQRERACVAGAMESGSGQRVCEDDAHQSEDVLTGTRHHSPGASGAGSPEEHCHVDKPYDSSADQDAAIVQRILTGTWALQPAGTEGEVLACQEPAPPHGSGMSKSPPCTSCGREFLEGDIIHRQPPFTSEGEWLCQSCFTQRYPQTPSTSARSPSMSSVIDREGAGIKVHPLHDDPELIRLASQGGAMGDIRQHIQQEMHRLLGPTHQQQQPREVAAPSPRTPRQQAHERPKEAPETPHAEGGQI